MEFTGDHAQKSSSHLLWGVFGCCFLYFIGSTLYSVYLSPLAKYPGPKLNAATELPFWWNALRGRQISWYHALHQRYGAIVRVSPTRLSYIDAQAWKDIYGHRTGGKKSFIKDRKFYTRAVNGANSVLNEADDDEHGRVRKIFSHAFSQKALVEQEPLIRHYVDLLISKTRESASESDKPFDMVKLYNFTTFDIMADLTFGESLHQIEDSQYSPWVSVVFGAFKAADMFRVAQEYPILSLIWKFVVPASLLKMRKDHFQYSVDRVEHRLASPTEKADIWGLTLRNGGLLDRPKMHSNAALFMLAGTETTATLLSGLTYHLLRNPDKLHTLVDEIRNSFESEEDMNLVNLQRLTYLEACLNEGFRMYPPVPLGLPRQVPEGGAAICGKWVPGGIEKTRAFVSQFAAYQSALNFREPESFLPERWMDGTGFDTDKKDVLQPFSFGPRNCLGKNLAYHEMRLILARTLWAFDMELCEESIEWANHKAYTLWEKPPLMVRLTPLSK